jgi:hypothetical protein
MVEFKEQYIPHSLAPVLFVPLQETVLMRIAHEDEAVSISLIDPSAHDLEASERRFSEIKLFCNRSGFLDALTAPSFSGKMAISLVKKVMELARVRELLLGDGSTLLGCCEEGALTSLMGL